MEIIKDLWGTDSQGGRIYLYTLINDQGMKVSISQWGGIITKLIFPTQAGPLDIVLGFENYLEYFKNIPYFGAIIGRYANRIGDGSFSLQGE